jgi:hypothetical protein
MKVMKDKLRLVAFLSAEEINRIKSMFPVKRHNLYFHYSYYERKPNFFAVWLLPKKGYVYPYYNAMLSFNPAHPPLEALEIFNMIKPDRWMVSRLDIAFDFLTPYEDCFLLPPPNKLKNKPLQYNFILWGGQLGMYGLSVRQEQTALRKYMGFTQYP